MERPIGVTLVAIGMISFSLLLMGLVGIGALIALVTHPANVFLALPVTVFYLLLLAIPGAIGYGLWNLENKARIGCLLVLGAGAIGGLILVMHSGLFSPISILYFPYIIIAGAIAVYLQLSKVKNAFEGEINVINFKEL